MYTCVQAKGLSIASTRASKIAYAPDRAWGTYDLGLAGALALALPLDLVWDVESAVVEVASAEGPGREDGPGASRSEMSDMPSGRGEVEG